MSKEQPTNDNVIRNERILDNIMVPVFFESDSDEAKMALEEILRSLLNDPALTVQGFHAEHVLTNAGHHGVQIDVWARDGSGCLVALELQKDIYEPILHRSVFEAATLAVHSLNSGEPYDRLPKIYMIFVLENDRFRRGAPLYITETLFTDGGREMQGIAPTYIFVNGAYKNLNTQLGRVIHDLTERDPENMVVPIIRKRADMVKNTKEGRDKMNAVLEAFAARNKAEGVAEGVAEGKVLALYDLVRDGDLSIQKAAERLGISEAQLAEDLKRADE